MNNTVIQENSGINSFYAKVYSLVGMGIGISALVSALMLTIFQDVIYSVIMANSWIFYLVGSCLGSFRDVCQKQSSCIADFSSLFGFKWLYD